MYIPVELNVELIISKLCIANHVYPILYLTDKSKVSTLVMFMINTIVRFAAQFTRLHRFLNTIRSILIKLYEHLAG